MKVVYVLEDLGLAGGVKVIVEHAEGLAARGHDVSIVTRGARPSWIDVRVPLVHVPDFSGASLPEADIHVTTWYTTVVPTVKAARARSVFHFSQGYEAIYPHVAHLKPAIDEAYSQPIPKLLISAHLIGLFDGRFPGPFHVVPQAIRAEDYRPEGPARAGARAPAVIGVVGPFEGLNKGIPIALAAVTRLRAAGREVHLHRASQMELTPAETEIARCQLYRYQASVSEMVAWYRQLDLLLHPSLEAEGLPLPPLEAMASGVPVVLTAIPSFDVLPDDAVSRVAPGDDAAMAAEAARLLDSPVLWSARRNRGIEVASTFTLERALDVVEGVFRDSLGAR